MLLAKAHFMRDRLKQNLQFTLFHTALLFWAPSGAQGVTLSVRLSVRAGQGCLEQSIFIILGQRAIKQSVRALREHSEQ